MFITATALHRRRRAAHPGCCCGSGAAAVPLALDLRGDGRGGVRAVLACNAAAQGYSGLVHGGVAAAAIDAAMTSALFARGVRACTARLDVRYRQPLRLGLPALVGARTTSQRRGWWRLAGEIVQDGHTCISATALFREMPSVDPISSRPGGADPSPSPQPPRS